MNDLMNTTILSLVKNQFDVFHIKTKDDLPKILDILVQNGSTASFGGSMTLMETGAMDYLKDRDSKGEITLLDRNKKGLTREDVLEIYNKTFSCDIFFASANAITSDGLLYNVDGNCNRVSAMLYGPKNVIIIVGQNKLVKGVNEAMKRVQTVVVPQNVKRLGLDIDCGSPSDSPFVTGKDTICSAYTFMGYQRNKGRVKVILIDEDYGY